MIRRPPRSTRTDTLFPYTTLFRSPFWALTGNGGYTRAASNVLQARPCLRNGDLKNAPVEYFRKQVRLGGCRRLQCPCRLFERGAACAAASARGGLQDPKRPLGSFQIGRAQV